MANIKTKAPKYWQEGNPHILLVEMEINTATVESSMDTPQNINSTITVRSSSSNSGVCQRESFVLMFTKVGSRQSKSSMSPAPRPWTATEGLQKPWVTVGGYPSLKRKIISLMADPGSQCIPLKPARHSKANAAPFSHLWTPQNTEPERPEGERKGSCGSMGGVSSGTYCTVWWLQPLLKFCTLGDCWESKPKVFPHKNKR